MIGISYVFPLRRPTWRKSANGPREEWAKLRKSGLTKCLTKVRKRLLSLSMSLLLSYNRSSSFFHLLPQFPPLSRTIRPNRPPLLTHNLLHLLETPPELAVSLAQRLFRVNIEPARHLRHNKKHVAHLFACMFWRSSLL